MVGVSPGTALPANHNLTTNLDEFTIQTISGEKHTATYHLSVYDASVMSLSPEDLKLQVKEKLVAQLAKSLFESKSIEFTQETLNHNDTIVFRARIIALPDTQVRLLRNYTNDPKL